MSSDPSPDIPSALRDRLRDEDPETRTDLEAMWDLLGAANRAEDSPDLQAEWAALTDRRPDVVSDPELPADRPSRNGRPASERTASERRARRPAASPDRTARRRWTWAAAAILVLVVLGGGLWRQPVTVTARPGQQRTATLPDGSTVELNSGTTLTYRRNFQSWPFVDAERRAVTLEGEAFFRVEEEGPRPFVVETATARVTVTGTRFNVRARPGADSTTEVTIADGQVQVAPRRASTRSVRLDRPGQRTRVRGARAAPSAPESTRMDLVLAWRRDGFGVSEQPLTEVLRELERRYDTPLRLHESVRRTTAPVSLYYPTPAELSVILRDLCTALDLNYRPTNRGYEIFSVPDRR